MKIVVYCPIPKGSPEDLKILGQQIIERYNIPDVNATLVCMTGDIFDYPFDIIVNAANTGGIGGDGIDQKFNTNGGKELVDARQEYMTTGRLATGDAYLTLNPTETTSQKFGTIKAETGIIHAVGPSFSTLKDKLLIVEDLEKLKNAYKNSLRIATGTQNCSSLAFPIISGEIFAPKIEGGLKLMRTTAVNFLRQRNTYASLDLTKHLYVYLIEFGATSKYLREACADTAKVK